MLNKHVLVTTDENRRGVFAGILKSHDGDKVVLADARMAVYWSAETRGVLGLAATGPAEGSRITKSVPSIELDGVTSISEMTAAAVLAWDAEPWS